MDMNQHMHPINIPDSFERSKKNIWSKEVRQIKLCSQYHSNLVGVGLHHSWQYIMQTLLKALSSFFVELPGPKNHNGATKKICWFTSWLSIPVVWYFCTFFFYYSWIYSAHEPLTIVIIKQKKCSCLSGHSHTKHFYIDLNRSHQLGQDFTPKIFVIQSS